jgi:hypothetical protein
MATNQWTDLTLDYIERSREGYLAQARKFQRAVSDKIINEWIPELQTLEGELLNNNSNIRAVGRLNRLAAEVSQLQGEELANWYVSRLTRLSYYAQGYFSTVVEGVQLNLQKVIQDNTSKLLFRFGFDGEKFVRNGFIYDLIQANEPLRRIKAEAFKAISSGESFKGFQEKMRIFVNGQVGANKGVYEGYFRTAAFDSFQQFDRALANQTAVELELNFGIYEGGKVRDTRDFCMERMGQVFSREEMLQWENLDWAGKNTPYDPIQDLGGYNCRHKIEWINNRTARLLGRADAVVTNQRIE